MITASFFNTLCRRFTSPVRIDRDFSRVVWSGAVCLTCQLSGIGLGIASIDVKFGIAFQMISRVMMKTE
jgi:hypothetical protein